MRKITIHFLFCGLAILLLPQMMTAANSGYIVSSYSSTLLNFSGYQWEAASTGDLPQDPGPNVFSNNPKNVWVDNNGALHLRVTYQDGVWHCAEVALDQNLGYGKYTFYISGDFTVLDSNIVAGMFLYRDDTHEYDIELSQWGTPTPDALQYSIQPYTKAGNSRIYPVHLNGIYSSHQIKWSPNIVEFTSLHGHHQQSPGPGFFIADWQRQLHPEERMTDPRLHINLWLNEGKAPQENSSKELIISRFLFTPLQ